MKKRARIANQNRLPFGGGLLLLPCLLLGCTASEPPPPTPLPEPSREFRGVWVATVGNINWPSQPGLSVTSQKAELLSILDTARDNNLNAVVFQVRPACDALYTSSLEPWSEYLTGRMGQAPNPPWDPLEFVITAAHRRGLELHAWFNPFRALHHTSTSPISEDHVSRTQPGWVHRYGNYLWLDPGDPAARAHSLKVVQDVVRRYDIDAVHFDDYFYPYPVDDPRGGTLTFPDRDTWQAHGAGLSRDDWRRRNVDLFVQEVQQTVHAEKPWVQFGISPFGIWRPGHPKQIRGTDAYAVLYADSRKWLREGWIDYLVPQLYWPIDSEGQSFPVLLEWWEEQNVKARHLWVGLFTSRVPGSWEADEILNQVKLTRQFGRDGHVHYQIGALQENPELGRQLRARFYTQPALTPRTPWLDDTPPPLPTLDLNVGTAGTLSWVPGDGEPVAQWIVQYRVAGKWNTRILPGTTRNHLLPTPLPVEVSVRAVDRCGNLSPPARGTPQAKGQ